MSGRFHILDNRVRFGAGLGLDGSDHGLRRPALSATQPFSTSTGSRITPLRLTTALSVRSSDAGGIKLLWEAFMVSANTSLSVSEGYQTSRSEA